MRARSRLLVSFAAGPWAALPATLLVMVAPGLVLGGPRPPLKVLLLGGLQLGLMVVAWAYAGMLVLGIPTALILRKLGRFRARDMAVAGALAGALPFLLISVAACQQTVRTGDPALLAALSLLLVAGSMSGLVSALLVWWLAKPVWGSAAD